MTLDEYMEAIPTEPGTFWSLSTTERKRLLDEALARISALTAELIDLRIGPRCGW